MVVLNKTARVYMLGGHPKKAGVFVYPGSTIIPAAKEEGIKSLAMFKSLVKTGKLEIMDVNVNAEGTGSDEEIQAKAIMGVNVREAMLVLKECFSVPVLQHVLRSDERQTVKNACQAQLDSINEKAKGNNQ